MDRRPLAILVAAGAALAAACGSSSGPTAGSGSLSVTVSSLHVLASGSSSVTVHVAGATQAPIKVTASRGTLSGGGTIAGTTGDLTLVTCNASSDASCTGTVSVQAVDGAFNVGTASVVFDALTACSANCASDPACAGAACALSGGATGTCSGTPLACVAPVCVATQASGETSCSNGLDDDCNGKIDCADGACDGQPCKAGSPTFVCQAGACADAGTGGTGYALLVAPVRTRLPPDGKSTTAVTVTVQRSAAAAPGVALKLTTTAGTLSSSTATTGTDGTATVTLTAAATPGVASVTAQVASQPAVSLSALVTMPTLGGLSWSSTTFPVLGVAGSGWQETTQVVVELLDTENKPYPDGVPVAFAHQPLSGSRITLPDPSLCTTVATPDKTITCRTPTASPADKPDTAGLAMFTVASGTSAGTLATTATTTVGGRTVSTTLPAVPVIGARASGGNFAIECSPRNVPALADTTCGSSSVDASITCVGILKDRYGNLLGRPTPISFRSEAASVGLVATTPAYTDPTVDPTTLGTLGSASEIFRTLGDKLPIDVPHLAGEPYVYWTDACGSTEHSPRDGAVTIIAIADGEDGFTDVNGNGVYDGPGSATLAGTPWAASGEPFVDQGEPFVDANDNGQWDPGEWFLDVNGNGTYDPPGTTWQANTKIWTETVVVYTGLSQMMQDGASPATYLGTRWVDSGWVNACKPTTAPALPAFNLAAGTSPDSKPFVVVASDGNLNQLASSAAYAVKALAPSTVSTTYQGLPAYADERGFAFTWWPCDRNGHCATSCALTTSTPDATSYPCTMKPVLSGFSCGVAAAAAVTAGGTKGAGLETIDWTVDVTYPTFKNSKTAHDVAAIAGTTH